MFSALGHEVEALVRTAIGPIRDPGLLPGTWRHLSTDEVRALHGAATLPDDPGAHLRLARPTALTPRCPSRETSRSRTAP